MTSDFLYSETNPRYDKIKIITKDDPPIFCSRLFFENLSEPMTALFFTNHIQKTPPSQIELKTLSRTAFIIILTCLDRPHPDMNIDLLSGPDIMGALDFLKSMELVKNPCFDYIVKACVSICHCKDIDDPHEVIFRFDFHKLYFGENVPPTVLKNVISRLITKTSPITLLTLFRDKDYFDQNAKPALCSTIVTSAELSSSSLTQADFLMLFCHGTEKISPNDYKRFLVEFVKVVPITYEIVMSVFENPCMKKICVYSLWEISHILNSPHATNYFTRIMINTTCDQRFSNSMTCETSKCTAKEAFQKFYRTASSAPQKKVDES